MSLLFADATSDANALVILATAIAGFVGGGIVWLAGWVKGHRKDAIGEWQELFDKQQKDFDRFKADMISACEAVKDANTQLKAQLTDLRAQNAELIETSKRERASIHAQRNEENVRHTELTIENVKLRNELTAMREAALHTVGRVEHVAKSISNAVLKNNENIAKNSENINLLACRSGEIPVYKDKATPDELHDELAKDQPKE